MSTLHPLATAPEWADEHSQITWTLTSDGGMGDVVTELYTSTWASVIIVFASTEPGFEGFRVVTLAEAREASRDMGPGMLPAIESAPKMPMVRVFHRFANGDVTYQELNLLRLDADLSGAPS